MRNILIALVVVLLLAGGAAYYFWSMDRGPSEPVGGEIGEGEEVQTEEEQTAPEPTSVIGTSVAGNPITAYHYGEGDTELLFVGGIHGGYAWNTSRVAYELMDYLEERSDALPENLRVTVVPALNPDGLENIVGTTTGNFTSADVPASVEETIPGRFNGNNVDLNRNFDCDWQEEGIWQNRTVSGGSEPFSEPESKAIRDYVGAHDIAAVVVYYSAAGGVFASDCHSGVLPETLALTDAYADASGYPAYESFDFYAITGDMVNWLAKESVPAISVLLSNHRDVEWEKNRRGVDAVIERYAE